MRILIQMQTIQNVFTAFNLNFKQSKEGNLITNFKKFANAK